MFAAEQLKIGRVLLRRPPPIRKLLDDDYLRNLHRDMFREVWDWAGRYRRRETNIGIDPREISVSLRMLVDDAITWVQNETYEPYELAVRFHHRLVAIHPFPNGDGRHSRIAADYLVAARGQPRYRRPPHHRRLEKVRGALRTRGAVGHFSFRRPSVLRGLLPAR